MGKCVQYRKLGYQTCPSFSKERTTEAGQSYNIGSMPKRADELDNGS
ncbi:TPA: hypothetical protein ACRUEF_002454 [Staphylococcus aureus]